MAAGKFTDDAFLGGRINLLQPQSGFRSGLDAVMLAAAVPAKPRQTICDLGAGVGAAGLCLATRIADLQVTAIEIEPQLVELSRENHSRNNIAGAFEAIQADILARPRSVPRQYFHHVLTNPPFYDSARGTVAPQQPKALAKAVNAEDLMTWLKFARSIVRPKGTVTAILPPAQMPLALSSMSRDGLGAIIIPLWPKQGDAAKRVIIHVRTDSRAPLQLQGGIVLHEADGRPTLRAEEILRGGGALTT